MDKETLIKNVQGLTDEQVAAIVTMSGNELAAAKTAVTNEVTGSIYQNLDNDMKTLGFEKPDGKKSYEHIKEVVSKLKGENATIASLNSTIEELRKNAGGDAELKKQIGALETKVKDITAQLDAERSAHANDKTAAEKAMSDYKVNMAVKDALAGIKFKSGVGDRMLKLSIADAQAEALKDKTVQIDEDGRVTFRDKDGNLLLNPNNLNNPYTMKELLMETAAMKEVVDQKKTQTGGGTKGGSGGGGSDVADISSAKTQVEADEAIRKHLFGKGIAIYDPRFEEEFAKLRSDNNVDKLPLM